MINTVERNGNYSSFLLKIGLHNVNVCPVHLSVELIQHISYILNVLLHCYCIHLFYSIHPRNKMIFVYEEALRSHLIEFKGTVSRDFLLLVFFINQFP